jgi:hypothetical protein
LKLQEKYQYKNYALFKESFRKSNLTTCLSEKNWLVFLN